MHDEGASHRYRQDVGKGHEELIERPEKIRMLEMSRLRCPVRFPLLVTLPPAPGNYGPITGITSFDRAMET